jgi:hypothetical protein
MVILLSMNAIGRKACSNISRLFGSAGHRPTAPIKGRMVMEDFNNRGHGTVAICEDAIDSGPGIIS